MLLAWTAVIGFILFTDGLNDRNISIESTISRHLKKNWNDFFRFLVTRNYYIGSKPVFG